MKTKVENSSFISEFDQSKVMVEVLDITLKSGKKFRYFGVPSNLCKKFKDSKSKGRFFTQNIKDQFAWEEL